jgi:hypothetical protein
MIFVWAHYRQANLPNLVVDCLNQNYMFYAEVIYMFLSLTE